MPWLRSLLPGSAKVFLNTPDSPLAVSANPQPHLEQPVTSPVAFPDLQPLCGPLEWSCRTLEQSRPHLRPLEPSHLKIILQSSTTRLVGLLPIHQSGSACLVFFLSVLQRSSISIQAINQNCSSNRSHPQAVHLRLPAQPLTSIQAFRLRSPELPLTSIQVVHLRSPGQPLTSIQAFRLRSPALPLTSI
ncbi:unnamed protein product [Lota lota]